MVEKATEGLYRVQGLESAQDVARTVYGDVHKSTALLRANPYEWDVGDLIKVPGRPGRVEIWREDETVGELIKRMFPNQPVHIYLYRLAQWNGRAKPGDVVFVPER